MDDGDDLFCEGGVRQAMFCGLGGDTTIGATISLGGVGSWVSTDEVGSMTSSADNRASSIL